MTLQLHRLLLQVFFVSLWLLHSEQIKGEDSYTTGKTLLKHQTEWSWATNRWSSLAVCLCGKIMSLFRWVKWANTSQPINSGPDLILSWTTFPFIKRKRENLPNCVQGTLWGRMPMQTPELRSFLRKHSTQIERMASHFCKLSYSYGKDRNHCTVNLYLVGSKKLCCFLWVKIALGQ